MKKTSKSSMKKYQTGGRTVQNSAGSGRVPTPPAKKPVNKTVTKGNGKVTVSYKGANEQTTATRLFGTSGYPTTIKKVYDNKGNLISATKTVKGAYGSSVSTPIKSKSTAKPTSKSSGTSGKVEVAKPKAGSVTMADGSVKLVGSGKVVKPATSKPSTASSPKPVNKPGTGTKPTAINKPAVKTPAKSTGSGKTVSQLWTEKTGLPWSEAKKQGMSDGSAASNMALMKKLQSGSPMEYTRAYKGPDYSGDAAAEAAYGEAQTTMRKGGSVKKKMKSKKK
jgi:hypothetical protein